MTHDASQPPAVLAGKKSKGKFLLPKILGFKPMIYYVLITCWVGLGLWH